MDRRRQSAPGPSGRSRPRPRLAQASRRGDGGRLLAEAISLNAAVSAVTGLALMGAGSWLGPRWDVAPVLLVALGAALMAFAAVLVWLLATPRRLRAAAPVVIGADVAWVVGAAVAIGLVPTALPPSGDAALAAVTAAVAALAVGQLVGRARLGEGPVAGTIPFEVAAERVMAADADAVWLAVADAGRYADYVDGIADTRIVDGEGEGMMRVCRDDHGKEWSETCTLWQEGRRYRMSVDVATYPWYYRILLAGLSQTWELQPAEHGTRVTLRFTGAVKLGVLGRVGVAALSRAMPPQRILTAYERDLTGTGEAEPPPGRGVRG